MFGDWHHAGSGQAANGGLAGHAFLTAIAPERRTAHLSEEDSMSLTYAETVDVPRNPLDLVEEIVGANNWAHERASTDELAVEVQGRWSDYRLFFLWQEDMGALHFSCIFESRVPVEKRREILFSACNDQ